MKMVLDYKWDMSKQMLGAIARYFLAMIAGWLVAHEIVPKDLADAWLNEAVTIVAGFVVFMIILIWKWLNARFNILALIQAVQTDPPADTKKEIRQAVQDVKAEVSASGSPTASF